MRVGMARRLVATVMAALVCGVALAGSVRAQELGDTSAQDAVIARLYAAGKYEEAARRMADHGLHRNRRQDRAAGQA